MFEALAVYSTEVKYVPVAKGISWTAGIPEEGDDDEWVAGQRMEISVVLLMVLAGVPNRKPTA